MTPTIQFDPCNPDDLANYIDQFIITNHSNEIVAVQHNNIENGLLTLINASYKNWNRATVRTTVGNYAPTCNECILLFRSNSGGTVTLMNNRWNEWVIVNQSASNIQLIGTINNYWNTSGGLINYVPAKSVVQLSLGSDNNWYQINALSQNVTVPNPPIAGVVGGTNLPVGGSPTYQDNRLIGLGSANGGDISFTMAGNIMYNYSGIASFEFNSTTGTITLLYGTFNTGDPINIDLNQ